MAGELNFTRKYARFGKQVREFEKTPDITSVLAWTICEYGYPYDVYIEEKFVAVWLREGEKGDGDICELDMIFIAKGQGWAEIVLRDHCNEAVYGGWLDWRLAVAADVTDEIVNGYRVINVKLETGEIVRHEFGEGGYHSVGPAATASLARARRKVMRAS